MRKLIRLTEQDIHNIVRESVRNILEGASKKLYHYCGIDNLKKMIRTDKFYFFDEKYIGIKDYGFSTTRMRNSKQGFAPMVQMYGNSGKNQVSDKYLIRLELDGEAVQNLQYNYRKKQYGVKVKPFDYFWYENEAEDERLNGKQMEFRYTADDPEDEESLAQIASQAEDRITAKKKTIEGFRKCLTRIDTWFNIEALSKDLNGRLDAIETIEYLYNLCREMPDVGIFIYTNRDAFNIQANRTVPIEAMLDELKRQ